MQTEVPFLAGVDPEGQPVFESVLVEPFGDEADLFRLVNSPLLTRNLAAGDQVRLTNPGSAQYELVQRSGNLCIRVFRRHQLMRLSELQNERALVYSIHYSIGFQTIENVMNECIADYPDTVWYYGNVYDPNDGSTPLNWWNKIDSQD
jgi:hypothetical protein